MQKPQEKRTILKEQCFEVLSEFEGQELTSRQVYDLLNDATLDPREVAAVLYQIAARVKGKYANVYNTRKGVYVYSLVPQKARRTPSQARRYRKELADKKSDVTITKDEGTFTITARSSTSSWGTTTSPVFDSTKGEMLPESEQVLVHHADGSVWHARRIK